MGLRGALLDRSESDNATENAAALRIYFVLIVVLDI
jgi:hypothetical protein